MSGARGGAGLHPFQKRGLGFAPFVLARLERHAGGGCAYCGNIIGHRFVVRDVDGREFSVGSDCIAKVGCEGRCDPALVRDAKRMAKEAERIEWARRLAGARQTIAAAPAMFMDGQHPWDPAKTLRDDVLWRLGCWSQAERRKAIVQVERAARAEAVEG